MLFRSPQAQVVPDERVLSSFALARNALIELVVRLGLRGWGCARGSPSAGSLPGISQSGGPRAGIRRGGDLRLAQVTENLPDHHRLGDESDDPHFTTALGVGADPKL